MPRSGPLRTDAQWEKIQPLLPARRKNSRGGRPWANDRDVLEGILWVLRSGARWQDLPERYPHPSTCWRRLRDWEGQDVWLRIWRTFWGELNERQQLKWSESFLDGSFAPAKKGALGSGKPSGARGQSGWGWSTARVFLWETSFAAAPNEVRLAEPTLAAIRVPTRGRPRQKPPRVIADKGYDSDPLRERLARRRIQLIAPHRWNRGKPPTQDGRPLRRYRRRWIIERTFAWLGNNRRLVVGWDRSRPFEWTYTGNPLAA